MLTMDRDAALLCRRELLGSLLHRVVFCIANWWIETSNKTGPCRMWLGKK